MLQMLQIKVFRVQPLPREAGRGASRGPGSRPGGQSGGPGRKKGGMAGIGINSDFWDLVICMEPLPSGWMLCKITKLDNQLLYFHYLLFSKNRKPIGSLVQLKKVV